MPQKFVQLFRSIRFRLTIWFVLILGLVITAFSVFIYVRLAQDLQRAAVGRLMFKEQRFRDFLRFSNQAFPGDVSKGFPINPVSGQTFFPFEQDGDSLAVVSQSGEILQSWGTVETVGIEQLITASINHANNRKGPASVTFATINTNNSRAKYVMNVTPIFMESQIAGYFLTATPVDPDDQLERLLISLVFGIIITLGVAMAGGVWLSDRAMRPVQTITQAAQAISETDLNLRLHLERSDELGKLADTFDEMLDRLQFAFERQKQFTADASHELRTPLTIVDLEASRALSMPRSSDDYEKSLQVIKSENQFMIRLVNNLLTLARMDAGQVVLQKQEVDLSDVALEVVERLAPIAIKEQVRLSIGDLPEVPIIGDRQYLTQMLINLVENAIKYSTGTEKTVKVETGSRATSVNSENHLQAWVHIIDNGPGISSVDIPKVFDRFYQIDKARTRQSNDVQAVYVDAPSGAGLGLSIALWIAQAHGGTIQVESEPGKGSTFELLLPMLELPQHAESALV